MRISKPGYLLAVVLFLIPALVFSSQEKLSLTVEVTGAKPGKGQAVCSLFTSADTCLKQPAIKKTKPIDYNGEAIFRIDDLDPGTYAVSIVYDEDSNGELNTGLFGIPTEPVGVSNNGKENRSLFISVRFSLMPLLSSFNSFFRLVSSLGSRSFSCNLLW